MNAIELFLLDQLLSIAKSKLTPDFVHALEQQLVNKLWTLALDQDSPLEQNVVELVASALGCNIPGK